MRLANPPPFSRVATNRLLNFPAAMKRNGNPLPLLLLLLFGQNLPAQTLELPPRPSGALTGSQFANSIAPLPRAEREEKCYEQIALGNVPDFLRKLCPIHTGLMLDGRTNSAVYFVTPDYLAIGSDDDYFLTPLSPIMAQKIADLLHCSLPTRKMVDEIYAAAEVKLPPAPIPRSPEMATVPVFLQHNLTVRAQRVEQLAAHPPGALVAGDKKDVVITALLPKIPGKVAIYGWHKLDGNPIQPLYTGHADTYADYSHGVRLVQSSLTVNGAPQTIPQALTNPALAGLLSDEGPFTQTKYPAAAQSPSSPPSAESSGTNASLPGFQPAPFGEQTISYTIEPEVEVLINAPASISTAKKLQLIFYLLPNGNSIAETIGKQLKPGDDWHFGIQHIGAQTRFLRGVLTNSTIVIVYLKTSQKSWPAWRAAHADQPALIPQIFNSIRDRFKDFEVRVTLTSHSGGGGAIFGYLNAVERIPDDVERIAFLDSNYAYDAKLGHQQKLLAWLRSSDTHFLSVLAYDDAVALLDGKTFVSANGGTWGRSHAMLEDLGTDLKFTSVTNGGLENYTALNGRVEFLLKENPDRRILHTLQVQRNGFIQSMLSGTKQEGRGYVYFGEPAYTNWIGE
jgi:hypothetical protein